MACRSGKLASPVCPTRTVPLIKFALMGQAPSLQRAAMDVSLLSATRYRECLQSKYSTNKLFLSIITKLASYSKSLSRRKDGDELRKPSLLNGTVK